jgi:hypothetical protein
MTNSAFGLINGACKAVGCQASNKGKSEPLQSSVTKMKCVMKKMMEAITDIVRDPNHPFRKLEHQPKKSLKNRYERRKVKEYLQLTDWQEEGA